jgi:hypothetical protein
MKSLRSMFSLISGTMLFPLFFGVAISSDVFAAGHYGDTTYPSLLVPSTRGVNLTLSEVPESFPNSYYFNRTSDIPVASVLTRPKKKTNRSLSVIGMSLSIEHNFPLDYEGFSLTVVQDLNDNKKADTNEAVLGVATIDFANDRIVAEDMVVDFGGESFTRLLFVGDVRRLFSGAYLKVTGFDLVGTIILEPKKDISHPVIVGESGRVYYTPLPEEVELVPVEVTPKTVGDPPAWHQVGSIPPKGAVVPVPCVPGGDCIFTVYYTDRDKDYGDFPKDGVVRLFLDNNGDGKMSPSELYPMKQGKRGDVKTRNLAFTAIVPVYPQPDGGQVRYAFVARDSSNAEAAGEATQLRELKLLELIYTFPPEADSEIVLPGEPFGVKYTVCFARRNGEPLFDRVPENLGRFTRVGDPMPVQAPFQPNDSFYSCTVVKVRFFARFGGWGEREIPSFPLDAPVRGENVHLAAAFAPSVTVRVEPVHARVFVEGTSGEQGVPIRTIGESLTIRLEVRHLDGVDFPLDPVVLLDRDPLVVLKTDERTQITIPKILGLRVWRSVGEVGFGTEYVVVRPALITRVLSAQYDALMVAPGMYPLFEGASIGYTFEGRPNKYKLPTVSLLVPALLTQEERNGPPILVREDDRLPVEMLYMYEEGAYYLMWWFGLSALALVVVVAIPVLIRKALVLRAGSSYQKRLDWVRALENFEEAYPLRGARIRRQVLHNLKVSFRFALAGPLRIPGEVDLGAYGLEQYLNRMAQDEEISDAHCKLFKLVRKSLARFGTIESLVSRAMDFDEGQTLIREQRALINALRL